MEKYYENSDDTTKCKYNLVVDSCRACLFDTLCRLEKDKAKYLDNK
jgi:hypothetical protein